MKKRPQAEPLEVYEARTKRRAKMVELAVCIPIAVAAAFMMAYALLGLVWWPHQFPGTL